MKAKSMLLMVVALGLGLLATLGVSSYLKGQSADAAVGANEIQLVVADRDLPAATTLQKDMLKVVAWPRKLLPDGATEKLDELVGRTIRQPMLKGEPIVEGKLALKGSQSGMVAMIPKGMRAIAVKVNVHTGVAGFLLPGSHVDVLMTIHNRRGTTGAITKTILRNVQVLAVDQNMQMPDEETKIGSSVTLLVTPSQAEAVSLAVNQGKIHLALRSNVDPDAPETDGATLAGLISGGVEPAATQPATVVMREDRNDYDDSRIRELMRRIAEQERLLQQRQKKEVEAEPEPPREPITHTVEIIQGSEVTQAEFDLPSPDQP